jgi:hypothetical protein
MTKRQRRKLRKQRQQRAAVHRAEFVLKFGCSPEVWEIASRIVKAK